LVCFGPRAENPRVGGSIPPLATIKLLVYSEGIGDPEGIGGGLYGRHECSCVTARRRLDVARGSACSGPSEHVVTLARQCR
jgi:hypothetical protein